MISVNADINCCEYAVTRVIENKRNAVNFCMKNV